MMTKKVKHSGEKIGDMIDKYRRQINIYNLFSR